MTKSYAPAMSLNLHIFLCSRLVPVVVAAEQSLLELSDVIQWCVSSWILGGWEFRPGHSGTGLSLLHGAHGLNWKT